MSITTPIAYYKLDESSGNASDSVGSNTLTNTGTVTYVAGKINNGASETGSSYLSNTSNFGITGGAISISAWVQPGAYSSGTNCFLGQSDSGTFTSFYIERTSSTNVNFYREKGGVGTQGYSATYTFSASTWYHLVLTYDGTTVKAYINGNIVGSGAASGSGSSSITNSGVTLNGRYYNSSTPLNTTTELIDEVGIWNVTLTADEISKIYNAGRGNQYLFTENLQTSINSYYKLSNGAYTTDSVSSNTLTAGTSTQQSGGFIEYGGSGDNLSYAGNYGISGTGDLTISYWTKFTTDITATGAGLLFQGSTLVTDRLLALDYEYNGGTRRLNLFNGSNTTSQSYNTSLGTTWHHIALVRSTTAVTVYLDGTAVMSGVAQGSATGSQNALYFGTGKNFGGSANNYYDEIGLWSRALSGSEITQLYNSGAGLQYPFTSNTGAFFNFM